MRHHFYPSLIRGMVFERHTVTSVSCLHHCVLSVSTLVIQRQFKLKFTCHRSPLHLSMLASFYVTGVEGRGGALGDHALVPVPVVLQRVQDVLGVRVDQVSPRLPQRMNDVINEANLKKRKGGVMSVKMKNNQKYDLFYLWRWTCVPLPVFSPLKLCVCHTLG